MFDYSLCCWFGDDQNGLVCMVSVKVYAEVLTTVDRDCFQLALDRIAAWCSDWQLQIAIKKCCLLRIGPIPTGIDLYINGSQLPEVSTAKDLGITFDSHLSFTTHISSIRCTANQRVNLLFPSFLTRNLSVLVKAYVTCYLCQAYFGI